MASVSRRIGTAKESGEREAARARHLLRQAANRPRTKGDRSLHARHRSDGTEVAPPIHQRLREKQNPRFRDFERNLEVTQSELRDAQNKLEEFAPDGPLSHLAAALSING